MLSSACSFFMGFFWGFCGVLLGFLCGSVVSISWFLSVCVGCGWRGLCLAAGGADDGGNKPAGVRSPHSSARHWRPSERGAHPPAAATKEAPLGPLNVAIIVAAIIRPALRKASAPP